MDGDWPATPCTAFRCGQRVAAGTLSQVVADLKEAGAGGDEASPLRIFRDDTGEPIEVDMRGTKDAALDRLAGHPDGRAAGAPSAGGPSRAAGRPKLGVVSGEVTLLPRHWAWLKGQPGGASVTLRKLVDAARHDATRSDLVRAAQDAAYRFMTVMAGDLPRYEEALRALYAGDGRRFQERIVGWPSDIRDYAMRLAGPAFA